jgi:hypothetical protein
MFDDPNEIHAFIIGLGEVLAPWSPRIAPSAQTDFATGDEYAYYQAGRGTAAIVIVAIAATLAKLFLR